MKQHETNKMTPISCSARMIKYVFQVGSQKQLHYIR